MPSTATSPAVFLLLKIVKFRTIENLLWFCANFRFFSIYKNNIVDVLIDIFLALLIILNGMAIQTIIILLIY